MHGGEVKGLSFFPFAMLHMRLRLGVKSNVCVYLIDTISTSNVLQKKAQA